VIDGDELAQRRGVDASTDCQCAQLARLSSSTNSLIRH
jgi:hypothetical protein